MPKMQARRERVLGRRYAPMYLDGECAGWLTEKQYAKIMSYNAMHGFEYTGRESAYWLAPVEGE